MDKTIPPFPKIWSIGSPELEHLFKGPVEVTEKLDGSQFVFGKINGEIVMRSKGKIIYPETVDKLFKPVVDNVINYWGKRTEEGIIFYGEAFNKPKHNTLNYKRTPEGNFALFGVWKNNNFINNFEYLQTYAWVFLGCDVVPCLYSGEIKNKEQLLELLEKESYLGGEKIEGVVIKNYNQLAVSAFSRECFGKLVSEKFKERNHGEWKPKKEAIPDFIQAFKTEARWEKAVQHLRELGQLENSVRDIGKLCKAVSEDIGTEEEAFAKEWLWKFYKGQIQRNAINGIAEWYKNRLLNNQF